MISVFRYKRFEQEGTEIAEKGFEYKVRNKRTPQSAFPKEFLTQRRKGGKTRERFPQEFRQITSVWCRCYASLRPCDFALKLADVPELGISDFEIALPHFINSSIAPINTVSTRGETRETRLVS